MREITATTITATVKELVRRSAFRLCDEVVEGIRSAAGTEENETAAFALRTLCDNAKLASERNLPVCQDTGMAIVFAEVGQNVRIVGGFEAAVNEGIRLGYEEYRLRKSVLDPVTRKNTGDNTPCVLHTELTEGDKIKLTLLPKGFGSENMSKLYMLTPAAGMAGVMDKVVETVSCAGPNPCPPVIVGVGLGGTADYAMLLAKKALLRNGRSEDKTLADMEIALLRRINELGIGAQGFGGKTTALDVRIEKYPTHIAALPVGVSIQCNAHRMAEATI